MIWAAADTKEGYKAGALLQQQLLRNNAGLVQMAVLTAGKPAGAMFAARVLKPVVEETVKDSVAAELAAANLHAVLAHDAATWEKQFVENSYSHCDYLRAQ